MCVLSLAVLLTAPLMQPYLTFGLLLSAWNTEISSGCTRSLLSISPLKDQNKISLCSE